MLFNAKFCKSLQTGQERKEEGLQRKWLLTWRQNAWNMKGVGGTPIDGNPISCEIKYKSVT